ncbi:MAG: M20/M25/M40 family metallo-hydrolase [Caldilineaceae bacterium]
MTTNPYLTLDQQMVGDIYTSAEVMDNLAILCDDFGSRFGGTTGERQAAEFIKAKLEAYGLQNVQLEPVHYTGWRRGEVKLEILSPVQMTIPCITLPHSPPANLEGVICDLGDGGPLDFEESGHLAAGKIAMVNSKTQPRGAKRWVHRMEKYGRSILAGATGFIFVNHYPAYGPATGGVGDDAEGLIPAISVAYEDGMFLQRLIQRKGEVRLRLQSTDHCEPLVSWNVTGEIPGTLADPQIVMLGCHYDGHDISQGAIDPASGAVALLEGIRVLAHYAGRLPHTVRVALWGVEEIGLIGSHAYVKAHADELDRIRFYFNMDAAGGSRPKDVVLNEWQELATLFKTWQQEMALDFKVGQSISAHSDHFPFLLEGVPTGGMQPVERDLSGRGYGHTRYDTLDKAEIRYLREAAALAARLALRAASVEAWPASRRSKEIVAKLFDKPEYNDERAIMDKIAAYVAAQRNQDGGH